MRFRVSAKLKGVVEPIVLGEYWGELEQFPTHKLCLVRVKDEVSFDVLQHYAQTLKKTLPKDHIIVVLRTGEALEFFELEPCGE